MAEFIVRTLDRKADDFYQDAKLTKRGDVIAVCPDGWKWSQIELTSPDWVILKVPGMSTDDAAAWLAPEIAQDPAASTKTLQVRGSKVDLDILAKVAPELTDVKRPQTVLVPTADFVAARELKEKIPDPAVSAEISPMVIG